MKPRLILLVLCMTMFISLSAQTSTSTLKEAKELKDGGNYLEAAKKYSESRTANLVGKQLLDVLAPEAECYYMLDDYQQLDSTIVNYEKYRAIEQEIVKFDFKFVTFVTNDICEDWKNNFTKEPVIKSFEIDEKQSNK